MYTEVFDEGEVRGERQWSGTRKIQMWPSEHAHAQGNETVQRDGCLVHTWWLAMSQFVCMSAVWARGTKGCAQ